jgi:uncharacterized protein DUF2786
VGTNNRRRRAAKQHKRREGAQRGGSAGWSARRGVDEAPCTCARCTALPPPPTAELVQDALFESAFASTEDNADLLATNATALAHPSIDVSLVDAAVEHCLHRGVRRIWESGWQPRDAGELATRRLDPVHRSYLVDAIAGEAGTYAPATLDPRWKDQLDEIGAEVWWRPDRSHLSQWAVRHSADRTSALAIVIGTLGFALTLPKVAPILPLPGTPVSPGRRASHDVDKKVLTRIRALLAKAESTDFPEEAEALSNKAQELMTRFSLDRALLDADVEVGTDRLGGASARRIWLEAPYVSAKSLLANAVARANRCRLVSSEKIGFVTAIGAEVDLALVEILTTSLLLQANRAMLAHGSQAGHYGRSRTRSWRQSFLVSYATRIGQRLAETSASAQASVSEQHSSRLLPALVAREQQVDALFTQLFPRIVERSVSVSNADGWTAGKLAADLANLDTRTTLAG